MEDQLLNCLRINTCDDLDDAVVIEEPYIPYIPADWNGVLVLAESQNLSSTNHGYVEALRRLAPTGRMKRLGHPELVDDGKVGVGPWDDGSLKLAVEAAFGARADRTGVSNAVLWSQRDPITKANINPDTHLQRESSVIWVEMLQIIRPERVICSGNVAQRVVREGGWLDEKTAKLRLPSPSAMSRTSGMFREEDLLDRYREVARVIEAHPEWVESDRRNKIFFACHAVSLHSDR